MWSAYRLKALYKGGIAGFKEQHPNHDVPHLQLCQLGLQLVEELSTPNVSYDGDLWKFGLAECEEITNRTEHLRRQVIDDIPALILERISNRGAASAGHAGD